MWCVMMSIFTKFTHFQICLYISDLGHFCRNFYSLESHQRFEIRITKITQRLTGKKKIAIFKKILKVVFWFCFFFVIKPSKEWLIQTADESIIWLSYQGKSFTGCFTAKSRPFVSRRLDFCSADKNWISVCCTDCVSERERHDLALQKISLSNFCDRIVKPRETRVCLELAHLGLISKAELGLQLWSPVSPSTANSIITSMCSKLPTYIQREWQKAHRPLTGTSSPTHTSCPSLHETLPSKSFQL